MVPMKAKWDIQTQSDGTIAVIYRNLIANLVFECGNCKPGTPLDLILEYIREEGDQDDHIFADGQLLGRLNPTLLS